MNALTPFAAELGSKWLLTAEAVTRPTTWFLAWHIGPPGDAGAANEQAVGGDANYARIPITIGSSAWVLPLLKTIAYNTNAMTITPAAATSYTIYGLSIWDSLTGGNCLLSSGTTYPVTVSDLAPFEMVAGTIPIAISNGNIPTQLTTHGRGLFLDWLFTADSVIRPTSWNWGLATADPGVDGAANELTTGDDPDYVRKTAGAFNVDSPTIDVDLISRPSADAVWVPGVASNFTAPYAVIWDSLTAGNAILSSSFYPEKIGIAGQTLSISATETSLIVRA